LIIFFAQCIGSLINIEQLSEMETPMSYADMKNQQVAGIRTDAAIRQAASGVLASLAMGMASPVTAAKGLWAQAAMLAGAQSLGTCWCGKDLYYVGKQGGPGERDELWISCGDNPPHEWKIA
jgi:hypothetical protein